LFSSIWSFTIILGCPWHSNKSKSWEKQNSKNNIAARFCRMKARSAPASRRFWIRGISRVTRGYFLTLFAFYSLVSSVTYLQILTTNLFCGKFYKFQFKKKSLVWKFRNKIFAFKKITLQKFFKIFTTVIEHHSLLIYEIKKIGHRHRFWDSGTFMG
jgi:hypothetical protein